MLDDRYELESKIGWGSSADVFLAVQRSVGRSVAVKVLRPESMSEHARDGYVREGAVVASLRHPNIVTVHDVGLTEDGCPYFVMEYVEGNSLGSYLRGGCRLEPNRALPLFEQAAAGLAHAHRHGILHRDVKPDNILIDEGITGRVIAKLTDFGVATAENEEVNPTGLLVGTPAYVAPELFRGAAATKASDLYALGIVMYRTLAGAVPFRGQDWAETARLHLSAPVPSFAARGAPEVPPVLESIVLRCLEKDPADRYETAEDLLADLESARMARHDQLPSMSGSNTRSPLWQPDTTTTSRWGRRLLIGLLAVAAVGTMALPWTALLWVAFQGPGPVAEAAPADEEYEGAPFPLAPLSAWTHGEADSEPADAPTAKPARKAKDDDGPSPATAPDPFADAFGEADEAPVNEGADGSKLLGTWEGRASRRALTLDLSTTDDRVKGKFKGEPVTGRWWWEHDAVQVDVRTADGSHRLVGQVSADGGSGWIEAKGKQKGRWSVSR